MLSQQQLKIRNIDVKMYKLKRNLIRDTKKETLRRILTRKREITKLVFH